jgi:hypothetical protein
MERQSSMFVLISHRRINMKKSTSLSLLAAAVLLAPISASWAASPKETADVVGQGPAGPVVSPQGATLVRTAAGVAISIAMPTPAPGSYDYPPANVFQPIAPEPGTPEVFTGWAFIFNDPASCATPGVCMPTDFAAGRGGSGVYNFGGHAISGGGDLRLSGYISVGKSQFGGVSPLTNPMGAHVHLAIAPHGVVLPELLPAMLNTPVGSPPFWWLAIFD